MSSNTFSSDLTPDPLLRRAVIGSGIIAILGGFAIIMCLQVATAWRVLLAAVWLAMGARDLWIIVTGYSHCTRIRMEHTGRLIVFDSGSCCVPATLGRGSIVLHDFAWLRFRTENGRAHAELMRRKTAQSEDWRRLQVSWRHLGAGG